jgi:hypothetical protein
MVSLRRCDTGDYAGQKETVLFYGIRMLVKWLDIHTRFGVSRLFDALRSSMQKRCFEMQIATRPAFGMAHAHQVVDLVR